LHSGEIYGGRSDILGRSVGEVVERVVDSVEQRDGMGIGDASESIEGMENK
jgi:hypothetical protein